MIDDNTLKFANILKDIRSIYSKVQLHLDGLDDPALESLAAEVRGVRIHGASPSDPPLSIAFVGQYNAGKSTLIKVLTNNDNIKIDSDVCTDEVEAYDWNGVQLLDTPGVHAGRSDHDEKTYDIIDRADLLVFVITNELFDETIGRYFRTLAFERKHAGRMLLVVNKMAQDPGTPETKRADLEKVIVPLRFDDLRGVFVDGLSWLDAKTADPEDREELLEIANIHELVSALNAFIAEQGLVGRLTAPLTSLRGAVEQASALLSTEVPQLRATLDLLNKKRTLFSESRSRLRTELSGLVSHAASEMDEKAAQVADALASDIGQEELNEIHKRTEQELIERSERLRKELESTIERELDDLQNRLAALGEGKLAQSLVRYAEGSDSVEIEKFAQYATTTWKAGGSVDASDWPEAVARIGMVARNAGNYAGKWAVGEAAFNAPGFVGAAAARGGNAQKLVYNVGKFFGVKFRPWGAVNIARGFANFAKVVGVIGAFIAPLMQIISELKENERYEKLTQQRDMVRAYYDEFIRGIETQVFAQFDAFSEDFYEDEMKAIDEQVSQLIGEQERKRSESSNLGELRDEIEDLIDVVSELRPGRTLAVAYDVSE